MIVETNRDSSATTATEQHIATQHLRSYEEFDIVSILSEQAFGRDYRDLGEEDQHDCFVRGYN